MLYSTYITNILSTLSIAIKDILTTTATIQPDPLHPSLSVHLLLKQSERVEVWRQRSLLIARKVVVGLVEVVTVVRLIILLWVTIIHALRRVPETWSNVTCVAALPPTLLTISP